MLQGAKVIEAGGCLIADENNEDRFAMATLGPVISCLRDGGRLLIVVPTESLETWWEAMRAMYEPVSAKLEANIFLNSH